MAFGRNPHVVKAQAAELKATEAPDDLARTQAYRDAAHQWERAAEREKPGKQRDQYLANATKNRDLAEDEAPVIPREERIQELATRIEEITARGDAKQWN